MGSVHLRRSLTLLFLAAALCVVAPASAFAAERVVRPVQTYSAGTWTIAPAGALTHEVLADPVAAPSAPDTGTGYIATKAYTPSEVGFAAPAITTGETVTDITLHTYFATGSGRALTVELRSGATLLGFILIPEGLPAGWYEVKPFGTPTLGQLSDLRMRATAVGPGTSTDVKVFAAYVVVSTTSPASGPAATGTTTSTTPVSGPTTNSGTGAQPGGTSDTPGVGGGDGAGAGVTAPITLPVQMLTLAGEGMLAVPLTCRLAAGCTGTVTTRLIGSATSARRRKVSNKKPRNRFRLAAGQSKRVPVQLDRRTARFVKRKKRAKVAITIAIDGATPVTKQVTVAARRGAARRRK